MLDFLSLSKSTVMKNTPSFFNRHKGDFGKNMGGRWLRRHKRQLQMIDDHNNIFVGISPAFLRSVFFSEDLLQNLSRRIFGQFLDKCHESRHLIIGQKT